MFGSLEFPVMLHAAGKRPVMGIIERLTLAECDMRSLVEFELETALDFVLLAHGGVRANIAGRVAEKRDDPPRHHYVVRLDQPGAGQAEALERVIEELHQRRAAMQTRGTGSAHSLPTVHVDFPVGYAIEDGGIGNGRALELSAAGMLMESAASIDVGATLELTFDLPERTQGGRRELVVTSRVVAHQPAAAGAWKYHIAFFHVEPAVHEEIVAFVGR